VATGAPHNVAELFDENSALFFAVAKGKDPTTITIRDLTSRKTPEGLAVLFWLDREEVEAFIREMNAAQVLDAIHLTGIELKVICERSKLRARNVLLERQRKA
jgi:hypothetical protein